MTIKPILSTTQRNRMHIAVCNDLPCLLSFDIIFHLIYILQNTLNFFLLLIHHLIKEVVLFYHSLNRFIYLAIINRTHDTSINCMMHWYITNCLSRFAIPKVFACGTETLIALSKLFRSEHRTIIWILVIRLFLCRVIGESLLFWETFEFRQKSVHIWG